MVDRGKFTFRCVALTTDNASATTTSKANNSEVLLNACQAVPVIGSVFPPATEKEAGPVSAVEVEPLQEHHHEQHERTDRGDHLAAPDPGVVESHQQTCVDVSPIEPIAGAEGGLQS